MKHLFIGGCADGQWHNVSDGYKHWIVPALPKPALQFVDIPEAQCFTRVATHQYRREWIVSGEMTWELFVDSRLTMPQAVQKLIENYRPTPS